MRISIVLLACWVLFAGAGHGAFAAGQNDDAAGIVFDLPSQPLGAAILAYTQKTSVEVFVDDALVAGRHSMPLHGRYQVEAALRTLLAGSGLVVRRVAPNAFTLVSIAVREPQPGQSPTWAADGTQVHFYATVQAAVRSVICAQAETQPGLYRAAVAVWVDAAGDIDRIRMLSPDVGGQIGQALVAGLQGLSLGGPPPTDIAQPVVFVVLPRASDVAGDCRPAADMDGRQHG